MLQYSLIELFYQQPDHMKNLFLIFIVFFLFFFRGLRADSGTISGFVTDSTSGENLIGANVYLEGQPTGNSSNEHGYYVLHPVPEGSYVLKVSYLGYRTASKAVSMSAGERQFLNISLVPEAVAGEEVIISAEAVNDTREINLGRVDLSVQTVRDAPSLGEADLFRTLQAIPGVIAESDFSTGLVVRGGNTDQKEIGFESQSDSGNDSFSKQ